VGVLVVTPPIAGLLNTPVKQELIDLTHKTPRNGTTPPLKGARLDHFVMDNAFKTLRLFRYEGG